MGAIFHRSEGQGDPVVLIHGVGLDHTMWDATAAVLSAGHRVIRYDMLGHGQSENPAGERRLDDFVDQLARLLDELELPRASLVGFSMGGLVALRFALRFPERLERLVILNSVYRRTSEQAAAVLARVDEVAAHGPSSTIDAALARWFSPEYGSAHPEVLAAVRARLEANDPRGYLNAYRVFAHADDELAGQLENIAAPTLVMTGELDIGSTPAMAEAMAAEIPNAQLAVLEGQRHMMPVEAADAVNAALLDFLDSGAA